MVSICQVGRKRSYIIASGWLLHSRSLKYHLFWQDILLAPCVFDTTFVGEDGALNVPCNTSPVCPLPPHCVLRCNTFIWVGLSAIYSSEVLPIHLIMYIGITEFRCVSFVNKCLAELKNWYDVCSLNSVTAATGGYQWVPLWVQWWDLWPSHTTRLLVFRNVCKAWWKGVLVDMALVGC